MATGTPCGLCVNKNRWTAIESVSLVIDNRIHEIPLCHRHDAVVRTLFAPVLDPDSPAGSWRATMTAKKAAPARATSRKPSSKPSQAAASSSTGKAGTTKATPAKTAAKKTAAKKAGTGSGRKPRVPAVTFSSTDAPAKKGSRSSGR